jgi:hypothetical protein
MPTVGQVSFCSLDYRRLESSLEAATMHFIAGFAASYRLIQSYRIIMIGIHIPL